MLLATTRMLLTISQSSGQHSTCPSLHSPHNKDLRNLVFLPVRKEVWVSRLTVRSGSSQEHSGCRRDAQGGLEGGTMRRPVGMGKGDGSEEGSRGQMLAW